eukprot:CAMPEP_0206215098 /NCGR_PEP_ID=MMETSP0047_2-20121206/2013_1 /ASSEMBLY_ACC=CAM_ASM_000192 /TAXON_ID=195065 /ORGANISM="Chroomonas mesostigmatica_cf, Strain CCMP1168" /LENGTH=83 /DNA_ID=CAMNT_0053637369 /DNA_START=527 /DNA_END=778 /DNA_ORIENTATION=+
MHDAHAVQVLHTRADVDEICPYPLLGLKGALPRKEVEAQAGVEVARVGVLHQDEEARHHGRKGRVRVILEPAVHVPDDVAVLQ